MKVMETARSMFNNLSMWTCADWKKMEVEFGDKSYNIVTAQVTLPKVEVMFPYSFAEAQMNGFV